LPVRPPDAVCWRLARDRSKCGFVFNRARPRLAGGQERAEIGDGPRIDDPEESDMLLVSTSVKPSPIHGLGCFTNERIVQGQVVWQYDARLDRRIPMADLAALPPAAQDFLRMYGYLEVCEDGEVYTLCGDHAKHMNHSPAANLTNVSSELDRASRDIEAGEELTCNYYDFDLDGPVKLGPAGSPTP
jgi:hypothetical protein